MKTEFTQANADFTDKAHLAAQRQLYPDAFGKNKEYVFRSTCLYSDRENQVLDGELSIDRIVGVKCGLKQPIEFSVQERFRRKKYQSRRDITITEWNFNSNLPSELYKIQADYFTYGYYDEVTDTILEALIISTPDLKWRISKGEINWKPGKNKKNQSFIAIDFDEIISNKKIKCFHRKVDALTLFQ